MFNIPSLTHWDMMTHICLGNLTIIGSDKGLSPGRPEAINWTNDGLLLIRPLVTNFSEILIFFLHFHSRKCILRYRLENDSHFISRSQCVNARRSTWRVFCFKSVSCSLEIKWFHYSHPLSKLWPNWFNSHLFTRLFWPGLSRLCILFFSLRTELQCAVGCA